MVLGREGEGCRRSREVTNTTCASRAEAKSCPLAPQQFPKPPLPQPSVSVGKGTACPCTPRDLGGGRQRMPRKWGGYRHHPCPPNEARSRPLVPQLVPKPPLSQPDMGEGTAYPDAGDAFGEGLPWMPRNSGGSRQLSGAWKSHPWRISHLSGPLVIHS